MVRYFLYPESCYTKSMSGFFEAAAHYDEAPEALHALIEGSPAMLGRCDTAGLTLLHYACREGHLDAVIQLVEVRNLFFTEPSPALSL